jgi:oxalate decarboxylase/phosphoglucose isomerase-like protein (cupin superfamily)
LSSSFIPEKLATYGTHDKRRRQTKQTIQRNWNRGHKIKDEDKQKKQKSKTNPFLKKK